MSATRAYLRIVVSIGAATFALEALTGLPGIPDCLLGAALGITAACVPWRGAWLRLLAAWLRAFPGRDLAYLAVDCGSRDEPEAPAVPGHEASGWNERLCHLCEDHRMDSLRVAEKARLTAVRAELEEVAEAARTQRARACDAEAAAQFTSRLIAEIDRDLRRADLRRSISVAGGDAWQQPAPRRPYLRGGYSPHPRVYDLDNLPNAPLDPPFGAPR